MACIESMYNSSSQSESPASVGTPTTMSTRISFSNDLVVELESHNTGSRSSSESRAPPSTDFEFTITNNDKLISAAADDLFFKGRLLPFKHTRTTIKGQLLLNAHDDLQFYIKPPADNHSSYNEWKGVLGLNKSHVTTTAAVATNPALNLTSAESKKSRNTDGFSFANQDAHLAKSPMDVMSSGNPTNSDMEMGI